MKASESLSSDLSRFFTGSPTDKSISLLAAGSYFPKESRAWDMR